MPPTHTTSPLSLSLSLCECVSVCVLPSSSDGYIKVNLHCVASHVVVVV